MKRIILFAIVLLMAFHLSAEWIEIQGDQAEGLFLCDQQNRGAATIDFNLDGFELKNVNYAGKEYARIAHPQAGDLLETGMPDLPVFTKALIIEDQGTPVLNIISFDKTVIRDVVIYPEEEIAHDNDGSIDRFSINEEFYQGKGVYPQEIAWLGEPAIMRDLRVVALTFSPFQYNAEDKTLTIFSNIQVEVEVSGRGGINAKNSSRKLSRAFEAMYKTNTLNYDQFALREEYQVPSMIFICNNDNTVLSALEYLTDWKMQKGYDVVVATLTETGTTNNAIKNYIQDAYDNWENPPEYVTFIGDASGTFNIPTWYTSGSYGEGDHPYSTLEGNDVLGDIMLGRLTFSTVGTLQVQISKILNYEKNPYIGNTDWYSRALLTGDHTTSSGYSTVTVNKALKELALDYPGNFWDDDNFVEVYSSPFPSQMNNAINLGVSYFSFRGYLGMSGWSPGSTSNGYMLPFAVIPTCGSNNWQSGTGKAEQFVQMGSLTLASGGIGALGTTTSGTHTPFNNAIALGVWGGIFRDKIYHMGGAVLQGKYYLWLTFPQFQYAGSYVETFSIWNTLMGEASTELWTTVPRQMSAVYDEVIPEGANYYQVAVLDSTANLAEGAWVTLTSEDLEFKATAFCNSSGIALLDLTGAENGEYNLVVTKHNHIPIIETVVREQVDYYVDFSEVTYDDAAGNGNGIANPGETIDLIITMENCGSAGLNDVSAAISCNNDNVTFINTVVEYGDIASGATSTPAAGYQFELDPAAQGGIDIKMTLNITDSDGNSWTTWLMMPIEAPSLYASSYTIAGDGVIDPGETTQIYFTLTNNGNLIAENVSGELRCNNRRITISDSLGVFGNVPAGGTAHNSSDRFTIAASTAILPGTHIPFIINLTSVDGYDGNVTINVPIGEPQITDPYGPDEYGYWAYDDGDVDYDKCPVYDWIEIDPAHGGSGTSVTWAGGPGTGNGEGRGNFANVELPSNFSFVFYGEEYDMISICSNGWVAPGFHETGNFMNYPIPGPQGPSPMIAVFWDDLSVSNSNVLWYFNSNLHYYVVQWSRITNGDTGSPLTFQVILYDPIYYPTTTGDSEIKMQYMQVTNNNSGSYPSNHGQYSTVGLENEDSLIGLQYTFNNTYPEACKSLQSQMAILFTPPPIPPDGPFLHVDSFYAFSGDDYFMESGETAHLSFVLENMGAEAANNVEVEISVNDQYVTVIDNSASYGIIGANDSALLENAFTIQVSQNVPDFHLFHVEAIISCDENSWNYMLPYTAYWPNVFEVDQDSIYVDMRPQQTDSHVFSLSNTGDLPVNFYVRTDETTPMGRDITGSFITCDTDSFTPGEETTWTFTVYNGAPDHEWVSDVWLDFPLGVSVLGASHVSGGSGGDMIWDGSTGAGQLVNWHGMTANGWGVLHDSEIATWTVDVLLSTEFAGDLTFGWEIGGDGYGEEPHNVSGEIYMLYPLRWINLDTSSGTLAAGETINITMNFDTNDIDEGLHTCNIVITCDSWDTKVVKIELDVFEVDSKPEDLPGAVKLLGNYPNPFNPETEIKFELNEQQNTNLTIYNLKGQHVKTLTDGYLPGGTYSYFWDGTDSQGKPVGSGVFFYRLTAGNISRTQKMVLLK